MNAIIALCDFCEQHGPCSVFCTQTLRDTKIDELIFNFDTTNKNCSGCNSIGYPMGMLSQDTESNANFLSTQVPVIHEVIPLVKQAAVRSLSCEQVNNKDGGFVYFGDSVRSHVLSHTFQLRDSQARGLFRLFSIIVLMKDKTFLLNIQPFLAENLTRISNNLQSYASETYKNEELKCSERANRLNSGQASNRAPRSLSDLTGQKSIFAQLHTHFTWILWAGARCLTETVTLGNPSVSPFIQKDTEDGFSIVQMDKEEFLFKKLGYYRWEEDELNCTFRKCRDILRSEFVAACYCTIIGIQIVLRGPHPKTFKIMKCLRKLLPESLHKLIRIDGKQYQPINDCRILTVAPEIAVPQPSSTIFRIDFIADSDTVSVKWLGELPTKWPDLLTKVIKAVDENNFNDFVLEKHLKVLVEQWKNKILCMKKITSNQELNKIKKILGVQQQDQMLVNYWSTGL